MSYYVILKIWETGESLSLFYNRIIQMFYVMVDVWLRRGDAVELFTEVPIGMLNKLHGEFIL